MSDKPKIIELIKRLTEAFPAGEFISISERFDKHSHTNSINITYSIYVAGEDLATDLHGISAVEAHVDAVIINKVNQEV